MKKTKIALLSAAILLSTGALVGCTQQDDVHGTEESETSTEDNRKFNIYFSQEIAALGSNLEIAKDSRFLLWKHVSVPNGTYTLEVLEGDVKVDNHVIEATGYGKFKIKISAVSNDGKNTQVKSLSGNVVSPEKVKFNELWDKAAKEGNYSVESELHGEVRHNERYLEFLNGQNPATGAKTYLGNVYDEKSNHWYTYSYSDVNVNKLEWNQGYGQSHFILGTTPGWKVKGANFVEKFDENNEPTGEFVFSDVYDDDLQQYTYLPALFENMFSFGSLYHVLANQSKASSLVASFDEKGNISLVAARSDGTKIKTFSAGAQTYDATTTLSDIGTTTTEAIENWLKAPTYLDKIDVSPLASFFKGIDEKKNYTVNRIGAWMNPNTGKIVGTPEELANLDGKGNGLHSYAAFDLVDQEMIVNHVASSDPKTFNMAGSWGLIQNWEVPSTNAVQAVFVKNGTSNLASGTMAETSDQNFEITYTQNQDTQQKLDSLWGTTFVNGGIGDLLDMVSFINFNAGTTQMPGDLYQFNIGGDDANPNAEKNLVLYTLGQDPVTGIIGGLSDFISYMSIDSLDFNANAMLDVLFGITGKELYFTNYFLLDEAQGTCSMVRMLNYSNDLVFYQETTWGDVGKTVLDDASKALLN